MPYSAAITRTTPACVLLLIDQSGSMAGPFAEHPDQTKAAAVADAVNKLVQNLVLRSAKADGVRDYFHIGVIGYGKEVRVRLGGTADAVLVPVSRVADTPLRVETRNKLISDGEGGEFEHPVKFPVWFDARANGHTPMCGALALAAQAVARFTAAYPESFPPIVLNLTDGKPSDGVPLDAAKAVRRVKTADGQVLLFNLLLSALPTLPIYFLHDERLISETYSRLLFRMSSELPPAMFEAARGEGFDVQEHARGVVFNADPTAIVRFLDIGTRVTQITK